MNTSQTISEKTKKQTKKVKNDVNTKNVTEAVVEPVTEAVVEPVTEAVVESIDRSQKFMESLLEMKKQIASLIDEFKKLQKEKKKPKNKNIKSGFVKEVVVSPLLADFVGIKKNELISRVNVTKFVTEYIKENKLQVESNKQYFKVNKKLANLLGVNEHEEIHYFKLQAHLKNHYPKTVNV
jgi:chromatin remodeling complex protein RSC6